MAAGQHARSTADHSGHLSVLLPIRWSTVHEEPKAVRAEEHLDRVQCHSGRAQRGVGFRGAFCDQHFYFFLLYDKSTYDYIDDHHIYVFRS